MHDIRPSSKKLPDLHLRRIKLTAPEAVEKALFLRRFGVPFWGLTYVFGHDDPYWERLELRLGHNGVSTPPNTFTAIG